MNAVKFTGNGGRIEISANVADRGVEMSVCDNGCGMPQKKVDRLFRLGEKSISTPGTEGEPGTGLGLLLVHEFVQRHGGSVRVKSTPGEGSCFTVFFPANA